jgi:anti-sigma factor RsiW
MRDCETLRDDLKAYLDGELSASRRLVVRVHLGRCASCREEISAMETIGRDMRAGEAAVELDPALRARILAGMAEESSELAPEPETPVRPWRRPLVIWSAAAAALLVWFVVIPAISPRVVGSSAPQGRMQVKAAMRGPIVTAEGKVLAAAPSGPGLAYAGAGAEAMKSTAAGDMAAGAGGRLGSERALGLAAPSARSAGDNLAGPMAAMAGAPASVGASTAPSGMPSAERHVTRSATLTLEVDRLEEKSDAVESMAREAGGFVASNQLQTIQEGQKTASLTVRVPTAQFDAIMRRLARLGEVRDKNVSGEDITEQVSDEEQAALVWAEEVRVAQARLRASHGNDWAAQENARQLRIRKAQALGRLQTLKKVAALATITVQLCEKSRTPIHGGFVDEMGDTGRAAINSFLQAARAPVLVLIWVLAYAPVWVPLAIGYRYAARLQRRRAAAREARDWQARRSQAEAAG